MPHQWKDFQTDGSRFLIHTELCEKVEGHHQRLFFPPIALCEVLVLVPVWTAVRVLSVWRIRIESKWVSKAKSYSEKDHEKSTFLASSKVTHLFLHHITSAFIQ